MLWRLRIRRSSRPSVRNGRGPGSRWPSSLRNWGTQAFIAQLDEVYRSGEPGQDRDARVMLGSGARAREAFFDLVYEPRRDGEGAVVGIQMIGVETTQVKHAQG